MADEAAKADEGARPDDARSDDALPEAIGDYRVEGVLGEGGMGRVYLAHDPGLDRKVAIKVLLPELARDADMSKRFLREARAMAKLSSPHVVTVFQVGEGTPGDGTRGEGKGAPFMVMEVLEGEDLGGALERGALAVRDAVQVALGAAKGLLAADLVGIVHRDVKPANLFLCADVIKLTDFGLARPMDGSSDLTQAGIIVGSPHYLAPELARGGRADRLSDIYALGATLFECCAGRVPYPASTAVEAVTAHIVESVPDLRTFAPEAPPALSHLVTRMLAKQPADRPQDYDSLCRELEAILRELPAAAAKAPVTTAAGVTTSAALPSAADPAPTQRLPADHLAGASGALTGLLDEVPKPSSPGLRTSGPLPAVKTKTLTVMFTDIAGYTERTGAQSREEAARWLQLHDELLRPVIRAYRGDVVKTIGDALLVTFGSPTDAVLCGTAIQDRLYLHNHAAAEAEQIHVRVAISAGEVRVHKGDVLGEPVNLAARLEKLAQAGEVVLSDAVYATMNTAEVKLEPRGTHQIKGIAREVAVYAAVPDGVAGEPPFGGRTLPSSDGQDALQWMKGAGSVAVSAAGHVAEDARSLADRALMSVRSDPRARLLALAAGIGVVLVVVALALFGGGDDPELLAALDALHEKDAGAAKERLESWSGDDVDERLQALLEEESWWRRHHAADVLKKRGKESLIDEQALAIKDLETGNACSSRRFGLLRLKRVARDDKALDAVKAAASRMPENICMSLEISSVEREIRKKIK